MVYALAITASPRGASALTVTREATRGAKASNALPLAVLAFSAVVTAYALVLAVQRRHVPAPTVLMVNVRELDANLEAKSPVAIHATLTLVPTLVYVLTATFLSTTQAPTLSIATFQTAKFPCT